MISLPDFVLAIEAAFADVPDPAGDLLRPGCHCGECAESVSRFVGKDWRTLSLEDAVSDQPDAIIRALSPAAFHFFLPGLMRLAVQHDAGEMIDCNIVDCLTVSDAGSSTEADLARAQATLDLLDQHQREVIGDFLGFIERGGVHAPEVLRSARENVLSGRASPYSHQVLAEFLRQRYNYPG